MEALSSHSRVAMQNYQLSYSFVVDVAVTVVDVVVVFVGFSVANSFKKEVSWNASCKAL
jgi:hypothetical protein